MPMRTVTFPELPGKEENMNTSYKVQKYNSLNYICFFKHSYGKK